jgi:hypothetical protein
MERAKRPLCFTNRREERTQQALLFLVRMYVCNKLIVIFSATKMPKDE